MIDPQIELMKTDRFLIKELSADDIFKKEGKNVKFRSP
jgi:hypothetical protein